MEAVNINRKSFCMFLKNTFVNQGESGLKNYFSYLQKENNKKKNSFERMCELSQKLDVFAWWNKHVKRYVDVRKEQERKQKQKLAKEQQLTISLANDVIMRKITLKSIKSDYYREAVEDFISDLNFIDVKEYK